MRVSVILEHRFRATPDGRLWSQTMFSHSFWKRYLTVFDEVNIVARVLDVPAVPGDWKRADGERVSFTSIPYYIGPLQYLASYRTIHRTVSSAPAAGDAVILRLGSPLAACLERRLITEGRPYGVEVVGDPYSVFAPRAVRHPLRPLLRWWATRQLRRQCHGACAAAYVTERTLQKRYPVSETAFTTHCSDVELPKEAIFPAPRTFTSDSALTIISVGSMEQLYKGQSYLIDAVAACARQGLDLELKLVGDGKHRAELEYRASSSGAAARIHFLGQLPAGAAVRAELDSSTLFVLPSLTEGLPRALIEAMARGLPCLGTTVGGIPELLNPADMVIPGDSKALAQKIKEVVTCPERLSEMSIRNLLKARDYHESALEGRRRKFYEVVKERTSEWLVNGGW